MLGNLDYPNNQEIPVCINNPSLCKGKVELGYVTATIDTNQNTLYLYPSYGYSIDGLVYYISYGADTNWGTTPRKGISTTQKYIKISNIAQKGVINIFVKPFVGAENNFFGKHHILTIHYVKNLDTKITPKNAFLMFDNTWYPAESTWGLLKFNRANDDSTNVNNGLNGKILLQVESHGEAWYVNPNNGKRYYMANGTEAYKVMRYLGVGITNNNLAKIKADKGYAKKFSGKIFLQVESYGEAYYIDFNGNANYLKDGAAAYEIMRSLGLGITNSNLSKISIGSISN